MARVMPSLAPPHGENKSSSSGGKHQRQAMTVAAAQQRSASFHGRGTEQWHHQPQKQRPKTLPDLHRQRSELPFRVPALGRW